MDLSIRKAAQTDAEYCILVKGFLGSSWSKWFDDLEIKHMRRDGALFTKLTGVFPDQAALRGILNKIWDLNLSLVMVHPSTMSCDETGRNDR